MAGLRARTLNTDFLRKALTLGLLSAIGPFAIDMYLPSLPSIGRSLAADATAVQLSLTMFFVALAVGQPLCGPLSDRFGRKPPLYWGLGLFALGSLGCALAGTVRALIAFRFLQGLGACAGMVVPRAMVRDLHTGVEATRLMSLLMLVFSISPILAPVFGSFIIQAWGWRAVFWAVLAAAGIGLAILSTLEETRAHGLRVHSTMASAWRAYGRLLKDRGFVGLTLVGAAGLASFFVYLSNSPFVLIEHYHLSPRLYSVLFSLNAAAFFAAAQFNAWLAARFGLRTLVRTASLAYALCMLLLALLVWSGVDRLQLLVGLLFLGYAALGMAMPTSAVLALEEHGMIAGTASSFMGLVQFAAGSIVMTVVGSFANTTPLPMVLGIAACACAAAVFAQLSLRHATAQGIQTAAE